MNNIPADVTCICLKNFCVIQHPLDPAPCDIIPAPAMGTHHPVIHKLPDVFGDRLRGHPELFRDLLLADCRLVFCDLYQYLQAGSLTLAP